MVENAGTMEKLLSQKIVSNSANDKWYEMKNMHIFFVNLHQKERYELQIQVASTFT